VSVDLDRVAGHVDRDRLADVEELDRDGLGRDVGAGTANELLTNSVGNWRSIRLGSPHVR
jgi:hypothetical protein